VRSKSTAPGRALMMRKSTLIIPAAAVCWAAAAFAQSATGPSDAPTATGSASAAVPDKPSASGEEGRPLEVVVQGQRPGTRGTAVEKLDRTMLDRFGATNVSEALDRLPSSISAFSARGERVVSLRGFDQRQILVTIDGVPVQVPYDGQLDLGKFPLGLVDHISVVKGAGSLLFGPNGLGGAIHIATRRPGEGPAIVLSTETAPFYAQRLAGVGTARRGSLAVLGGVAFENVRSFPLSDSFTPTYNENGGRRESSDRRSLTAMGKARWELDDYNEVVASAWHLDGQFGVPPGVFDLTRRFWRWSDWHVNSFAIAHGYRDAKLTVDETLYYSVVGNTLDSYDNAGYSTQLLPASGTSAYADRTLGGNARLAYRFACSEGKCVTARGWFGGKKDWHSSQASVGASWIDVASTTLTGAGQLDGPIGERVLWLAGTQVDAEIPGQSAAAGKPNTAIGVGPMGALTWQPHRVVDVTASIAQRTRFPTLKERFSSAFGNLEPNPSLAAERATNMSFDASVRPIRQLRVDAGVFDSEVRDLVIQVPLNAQTMQWQNAGRARFYGVELALRSRPLRWLEVWGGWAAMKTRRLDQSPPTDTIPYRPDQKATVAVTVLPIPALAFTVVGRYVGSQSFQNKDTSQWGTLGGYKMIDARVDVMAIDGLRLWLRGTNLLDGNVQGQFSFPEPGRQVFVGASVRWPEGDMDLRNRGGL